MAIAKAQHKPGPVPWTATRSFGPGTKYHIHAMNRHGQNVPIAYVEGGEGSGVLDAELEANVRLIVAAPELLAAAKAFMLPNHTPETYENALAQLRAAIRKAEEE